VARKTNQVQALESIYDVPPVKKIEDSQGHQDWWSVDQKKNFPHWMTTETRKKNVDSFIPAPSTLGGERAFRRESERKRERMREKDREREKEREKERERMREMERERKRA